MLTIENVAKFSGLRAQAIRNMITAGFIKPALIGTTGRGQGHRLSLAQAVGLAAFKVYRDNGASADRALGVFKLVESLGLEKLEHEIAEGRSLPVPSVMLGDGPRPACWAMGMMVEPPEGAPADLLRKLDLAKIVKQVTREADMIARKGRVPRMVKT